MTFILHPSQPQPQPLLNQCEIPWAPNQKAAKTAASYDPRRRRTSHQRIVDLTQCFSRHQISESQPQPQPAQPSYSSSEPSYFEIALPADESPAVSPFSRVPTVQPAPSRSPRSSRSSSPDWAVPYARPANARALRQQRIRNARLMTDETHRREVAALVERMVDERSQCRVHARTVSVPSSTSSSLAASPVISDAALSPLLSSVAASPNLWAEAAGAADAGMDVDLGAESDGAVDGPVKGLKFRRSGDLAVMANGVVKKDIRVRKPCRHKSRMSGGTGRPWEI